MSPDDRLTVIGPYLPRQRLFEERLPAQVTSTFGLGPRFIIRVMRGEGAHVTVRGVPKFTDRALIPPLGVLCLRHSHMTLTCDLQSCLRFHFVRVPLGPREAL
jgi:hypothetical protein